MLGILEQRRQNRQNNDPEDDIGEVVLDDRQPAEEVAQQQEAEVRPRRQRGPALGAGVELLAALLDEVVELAGGEQFVQLGVEWGAGDCGRLVPAINSGGSMSLRLPMAMPDRPP